MEALGENCFAQLYECSDILIAFDLLTYERERLDLDHDINVYDHEICIGKERGKLIFYLDLYFTSKSDQDLTNLEDKIFNF